MNFMSEKKILRIHREISFELFANLDKHIKINSIAEATGYNWRTVKNHLEMMSGDFRNRKQKQNSEEKS